MTTPTQSWNDSDAVSSLSDLAQALERFAAATPSRPVAEPESDAIARANFPLQNLPAHAVFARHWETHRAEFLRQLESRPCPLCGTTDRWTWFHTQDGYRYDVCAACGMVHIPEVLPLAVWDEYFATLPSARECLHEQLLRSVGDAAIAHDRERFGRYIGLLRAHGAAPVGGRLLDVGSYTGGALRVAAEHHLQAFGIEGLAEAVRFAAERFPLQHITLARAEQLDPGIFGGQFDVVTMWEALEHMVDPVGALRLAARALRPGGFLAVSVPNVHNVQFSILGQFCFYAYGGYHGPGHLNMFSKRTLERALAAAGFELVHALTEFGTDWRQIAHYFGQNFDRIQCYANLLRQGEFVDRTGPELTNVLNWISPALTSIENAWLAGPIIVALARKTEAR